MKRVTTSILSLIVILCSTACTSVVKNPTPVSYAETQQNPYPEQEYRIQVGDRLDIKFFYDPELNESVIVRPDGRISLQLAHEIMAAGLTPAELTALLTEKYASELREPEITVIVRSFSNQKVFVDGEVNRAGVVDVIRPMTVLQSISHAGGLRNTATSKEVIIIRRTADNSPMVMTVNLEEAIKGTDMSQDIMLMPLDIVYVPKSPIANINQWVDQYIRRNLPVPFYFGTSISQ